MKIVAIRGKNLASLEGEFAIDFTSEPLKSAGIFAITGQTGAGKSTLLDALCLALFDNAPRLSKAESVSISDVEDKTITQKDSRTILRRGTGDGYAEVDFIALDGNTYRSRWSVRRARGKVDGSLQATTLRLDNLSTGTEEQGTKSQLLARIIELIGLTFDQFTRAVLLAQGDFANFLKAKTSEKAELLEKLTGTEIYSAISIRVYEQTQEAKKALDLLMQRIQDIHLLSEEELTAHQQEKEEIEKSLAPLKKEELLIQKKLTWLQQEEQIKQDITQATEALSLAQKQIEASTPRYEYMKRIDASMEIRDTYRTLTDKTLLLEKETKELSVKEQNLLELIKRSEQLIPAETEAKKVLKDTEQHYEKLKPELNRAREIDQTLQTLGKQLIEIQKEEHIYQKKTLEADKVLASIKDKQTAINQEAKELAHWFAEKEAYRTIIPQAEVIASLLKSMTSIRQSKITTQQSLDNSQAALNTYARQLKQAEEEAERLNTLLPTEVITLREKLEEGNPCPVCGSTHHPIKEIATQTQKLDESALEKAKKKNKEAIEQIQKSIDQTQKSITEFETYLQSFQKQIETNYNELHEQLAPLPDWEELFKAELLAKELQATVKQWNTNKLKADANNALVEQLKIKLEAEEKNRTSLVTMLTEKQQAYQSQSNLLKQHQELRTQLLGGKAVDEVERNYTHQRNSLSKRYDELRTLKEKGENEKAALTGTITQLKAEIETNKKAIDSLTITVDSWIQSNPYQINREALKQLVAETQSWITKEKEELAAFKNKELVSKTTLEERKNRLNKHQASEDRPTEEESKELLTEKVSSLSEQAEALNKRQTEINVSLLAHQKGKEQIKAYEKEINAKKEFYEDWAKLNDLFGSANGNKFKTIAQGYTLDILLSYANTHLSGLSKRYTLEKIPDSLALQIIDHDQLGAIRSVHSLSGGESFLVSLALALGLSSLSSNRMKIESLFIDEGFGSLDIDTLSIAMDALENLQTQGRKIGVISHVAEMQERISTQIQVLKLANGKSEVKVVG